MKKVIAITILILGVSSYAYSCYRTKQCCRQTLSGLECIQKCEIELCPIGYDIEIK